MNSRIMAFFGEATKGEYRTAYYCRNLAELEEYFGLPPPQTEGLFFAIQSLLYQHELIFFRVREEGFSTSDYLEGLNLIKQKLVSFHISAIGIPGVGNIEVMEAITPICRSQHSIIITSTSGLYDYLTT